MIVGVSEPDSIFVIENLYKAKNIFQLSTDSLKEKNV